MEGVEFFMQVQLKQCLKKTVSLNQLDPTANGLLITINMYAKFDEFSSLAFFNKFCEQ